MRFALGPSTRSSRLHNHGSRRFSSRHRVLLILPVVMATLLAAAIDGPITHAATPSFAAKQDFATGPNPRSVAVGDLNGDGKRDLAVVNLNSNTASVLLSTTVPGDASPSFAAKQDFATGAGPVSVSVGDLNGDGKLDLAVANFNSNTVSVLLNTTAPGAATSSFSNKQDFATGAGPIFVTMGDLNRDGKPDLVVANLLSDNVSVLLNTTVPGAAAPSVAVKQDFVTGVSPLSVTVGDLNGDGKLDLAVANFNLSTVSVLLNTTAPGAAAPDFGANQEFATGDGPAFVTAGDLNGDGKLDIIVANFVFDSVSVLLNTTAPGAAMPSFAADQEFATSTGPIFVAVGDVNGDGRLDLTVANFNSDNVSILLNTTAPGAIRPSFAVKQEFAAGDAPLYVSVSDLNGDGKPDLAVANLNSSTVSVLLNTTALGTATPSFAVKQDVATGANPRSVSEGDLNGDGKLDLAVANASSNTVSVLLNTTAPGAATSTFAPKQDFATGAGPASVTVGDLNGDGKLDLAVANINSNTVSVLLNTTAPGAATPNFAAKQDFATGGSPLAVTVGDLNRDGKLDLAVANLIATVSVLLNTTAPADVTPSFAAKQDFATGDSSRSVAVGDLNGDGKLDLAVVSFNFNTVSVLLNTTDTGAATPSFAAIHDFPTGLRPISVALGDLNGDGKLDLGVANVLSNSVSVLLNTTAPGSATPSFAAKQDFATGFNPVSITLGDLNGDGKLELAVANPNSDNVSVLLNTTAPGADTPSFATKQDFDTSDSPVSVVARGDLNGDGKPDLAIANFNADTVSVLLNTPAIVTATGLSLQQGSTSINSRIARVMDDGGDGNVSIVVTSANPANGVTISNIVNSDGNIIADLVAGCGAQTATFTLQGSDGSSTVTGTLNITVTANTAPTLTYQNQTVAINKSLTIDPATGPSDNGRLSPIVKLSSGTFVGDISVDSVTGTLDITNPSPLGTHTITIRATDNCGATTDASFTLTVAKEDQRIKFRALANKTIGDPDFAVSATASSGLPVSFAASGQCTLSGNAVHITNAGLCTITASQAGDSAFDPSPDVRQSFTIASSDLINPIDDTSTFISLQYLDFLNRLPDPAGFDFWTNEITRCGADALCVQRRRTDVSAAFFIELEFQETGYVVYRVYRAALGTNPDAPTRANVSLEQFTADRSLIVPGPGLPQSTIEFANAFVQRPEFVLLYPNSLTNAQFVNSLFDTAGLTPFTAERQQQIDAMNAGKTRAQELLDVIAIPEFTTREFNPAFVLMQYFGYLHRNPDQGGYDFWLDTINNREPNNYHGMVCAFITSTEYQLRFGSAITHSNADCSQ